MKKNKLAGWQNVFSFTLKQTAKSKSFKSTTIVLSIILIVMMIGINVGGAFSKDSDMESVEMTNNGNTSGTESSKKEKEKLEFAHTIYYADDTTFGLSIENLQNYVNKKYNEITFEEAKKDYQAMVDEMKTADGDSAYLYLSLDESGIGIDLYLPTNSIYEESVAEKFCNRVSNYLEKWKEKTLGLTEEQQAFLSVNTNVYVVTGEETSFVKTMVMQMVPTALCLVLYMCIVLYGQMVGTSVATEKTSKVMELLLTSVRPLAIIVGKVLSMMTLSLLQILGFVILMLGGNAVGTVLAQKINPDYSNILIEALTKYDLLSMFSPIRIVLALFVFVLGFTFYCTFAGLMGATVNRGEDLSSAMTVYSVVSVFGFLLSYLPSTIGVAGKGFQTFAALFPISSPFLLPAKIITGEMSTGMIALGIGLLALFVVLFAMVVANVYEMVILYQGNKISLKQIGMFLKKNKVEMD